MATATPSRPVSTAAARSEPNAPGGAWSAVSRYRRRHTMRAGIAGGAVGLLAAAVLSACGGSDGGGGNAASASTSDSSPASSAPVAAGPAPGGAAPGPGTAQGDYP